MLFPPGNHVRVVRSAMRRLRPNDPLSVETDDDEEPLANGRCAIVSPPQLTAFHPPAELANGLTPFLIGLALTLRSGIRPRFVSISGP